MGCKCKNVCMDYILQIEKIITYLKLNYSPAELLILDVIKRKFNQDFNLLGCFLKDYLILKTAKNIDDSELYDNFVLYFEENIELRDVFLKDLNNYANYYLMIVFEKVENVEINCAISTINSCYCMGCYPLLMEILDNYFNEIVDYNTIYSMLKSLVNVVLYDFENTSCQKIDFCSITIDNVVKISNEIQILGGIAV